MDPYRSPARANDSADPRREAAIQAALRALQQGEIAAARALTRLAVRPRLFDRLVAEIPADVLADRPYLLDGLLVRHFPERLAERIKERWDPHHAALLASALVYADPESARDLVRRALGASDSLLLDMTDVLQRIGLLEILAVVDAEEANRRLAAWLFLQPNVPCVDRVATVMLHESAEAAARYLEAEDQSEADNPRKPPAAGAFEAWLDAAIPAPLDRLAPIFQHIRHPRFQAGALRSYLRAALFSSIEVEPETLADVARELEVNAMRQGALEPWVEVMAKLSPRRVTRLFERLPEAHARPYRHLMAATTAGPEPASTDEVLADARDPWKAAELFQRAILGAASIGIAAPSAEPLDLGEEREGLLSTAAGDLSSFRSALGALALLAPEEAWERVGAHASDPDEATLARLTVIEGEAAMLTFEARIDVLDLARRDGDLTALRGAIGLATERFARVIPEVHWMRVLEALEPASDATVAAVMPYLELSLRPAAEQLAEGELRRKVLALRRRARPSGDR